ncbi:hypothetical protein KSX_87640 [Ktedonospora formicarum]|uniref:Uncharacterized protein n=1 Tax=Ktedonospora formicarum TaxID=2778364 RepID=A0A8J3I8I9_9CHLR|nr:hypothetical protein KSX_87640 [Ktedonospora formicarum]
MLIGLREKGDPRESSIGSNIAGEEKSFSLPLSETDPHRDKPYLAFGSCFNEQRA